MMSKHATDMVGYLTPIGLIIAFVAGDRRASLFHLNQALVLNLISLVTALLLGDIPFVGGLLVGLFGLYCTFGTILGFCYALLGDEKPVPGLSKVHLLKQPEDPLENYYDKD